MKYLRIADQRSVPRCSAACAAPVAV